MSMTTFGKSVSFIATANPVESQRFYEFMLGLPCLSDDPFALVFDLGNTTLRIQKVDSVPEVNYTVLGWEVVSIRSCVDELSARGVQFERFTQLTQDELGIWSAPSGVRIAWFKDPDGNTLSMTEL